VHAAENSSSKLDQDSHESTKLEQEKTAEFYGIESENPANTDSVSPYVVHNGFTDGPSFIKFGVVENMIQAAGFAWSIGKPLMHHLTIMWPTGDWSCHEAVQRGIAKWQRANVGGPYYIWAKEGTGSPHSHFLLHLEKGRTIEFRTMVADIIKWETGLDSLPTGTIQCRDIHPYGSAFEHMKNRVAYLCKGGGPEVSRLLGIDKVELSEVQGKRAGVSQSLGVAARKEAGGSLPSGYRDVKKLLSDVSSLPEPGTPSSPSPGANQ
jgi:hypothetical protein